MKSEIKRKYYFVGTSDTLRGSFTIGKIYPCVIQFPPIAKLTDDNEDQHYISLSVLAKCFQSGKDYRNKELSKLLDK